VHVCVCWLGSGDSHWLKGKAATFPGIIFPSILPDLHAYACEHRHAHTNTNTHRVAYQWTTNGAHQSLQCDFTFFNSNTKVTPPFLSPHCDFHSPSFHHLPHCFAAFHSARNLICSLPLIVHSQSAATRLSHKQHQSLQQQKVGR